PGPAELLRELHQLHLCRHSPLTSSETCSARPGSQARLARWGPDHRLALPPATARTATPRRATARTTGSHRLTSHGGAPTPRRATARTTTASSALASQGLLNAWVSRARQSARARQWACGHTPPARPPPTPA